VYKDDYRNRMYATHGSVEMILDDVGFVENICLELKNVKVLKDDGTLKDRKRGITLRMLLTHTGMLIAILI
jgi:hypothetical protein